jgi:hypothetical protein
LLLLDDPSAVAVVLEEEARVMSQDVPPPATRPAGLTPSDTQRLREIRERLKRLERELSALPRKRNKTASR